MHEPADASSALAKCSADWTLRRPWTAKQNQYIGGRLWPWSHLRVDVPTHSETLSAPLTWSTLPSVAPPVDDPLHVGICTWVRVRARFLPVNKPVFNVFGMFLTDFRDDAK